MYTKKRMRKDVSVVLSICLTSLFVFTSLGTAQELNEDKRPSDFIIAEITIGTIGAILGGVLVNKVAGPFLQDLLGTPECSSPLEGPSNPRCGTPALVAMTVGSALGSSSFVYLTGRKYGVRGNAPLSFLGGLIGSYVGWKTAAFLATLSYQGLMDFIPLVAGPLFWVMIIGVGGVIPGSLATLGFNFGATMEVRALSLTPNGLELVSARARW